MGNDGSNSMSVINGTTNKVTVSGVSNLAMVAVDPTTNTVYVASNDSNAVSVIDGSTNTVTRVSDSQGPWGVAVDPSTDRIYTANFSSNDVSVLTSTPVVLHWTDSTAADAESLPLVTGYAAYGLVPPSPVRHLIATPVPTATSHATSATYT